MAETLETEIALNYDVFQRMLVQLLPEHRGEFALIRHKKIVGFFKDPGAAYREGLARYQDELFSLQEVDDQPVEMGLTSLALD